MAKKGNGEGNIRQRKDGRYEARYCVGTPEGLKRRSVYGKTRKEVADKLAEKLANKDDEPARPVQTGMTVQEFFAEYEEAIRHTIKRRSYQTSRDVIQLHLLPEFGTLTLMDLDRKHIQRMYSRKRDAGLSPATVKKAGMCPVKCVNRLVRSRCSSPSSQPPTPAARP